MNGNWFECKIKIEKAIEGGMTKVVSESYLVDALNFTEAEARIIKEVSPFCSGQLEVVNIKRARYAEIFTSDEDCDDKWYKIKCMFITLDEKTQTEKKSAQLMLVQASDLRKAISKFDQGMSGTMADYEIHTAQETTLLDVYPFEANDKKEDKPEYER